MYLVLGTTCVISIDFVLSKFPENSLKIRRETGTALAGAAATPFTFTFTACFNLFSCIFSAHASDAVSDGSGPSPRSARFVMELSAKRLVALMGRHCLITTTSPILALSCSSCTM